MKMFNLCYDTPIELEEFIVTNAITDASSVLVQMFIGKNDIVYIRELIALICDLIPQVYIIGSTTDGEIIEGEIKVGKTILSFSCFENTKIETYFVPKNPEGSYQTGKDIIAQFKTNCNAQVAISFADGLGVNGENYLKAFNEYNSNLIISGGLAGDNSKFTETIICTQDAVLTNGAVIALLYNTNLVVHTHASFGWMSIGKRLTITKAKENRIYEIDGIKAIDVFSKYLGNDIAYALPGTGISFPLILIKKPINIPRAVIGKHSDGSLTFAGNLYEGDEVTFGYGNVEMILDEKIKLKNNINLKNSEAIFIYSCMARRTLMGKNIEVELNPLSEFASSSGFFTYGEFYTIKNAKQCLFLNETMTILSLSESSEKETKPFKYKKSSIYYKEDNPKNIMHKALAHLIHQTTLELEEKNNELLHEIIKNKEKDKKLLQQSRLAQMGEMISMIAHQWRQPLASISAATIALKIKAEIGILKPNIVVKKSNDILDYVQHLSTTINDFRNFFKHTKAIEETTFCDLIHNTIRIIGTSLMYHHITIHKNLYCKNSFFTHSNELKQVLLNIIKNAEDALVENKIDNPQITITTYTKGKYKVLKIRDNAGGIPDNIIKYIFDPYFSTKNNKNGTGLGLYMSRTIIEKHCNGALTAYNDANGAVFKIVLQSL